MRNLIAEQVSNTPSHIVIQRAYRIADYKYENITETWTPRLKFFKPPAIYLFRWAYYIESMTVHSDKPLKMEIVHGSNKNKFTTVIEVKENKKNE